MRLFYFTAIVAMWLAVGCNAQRNVLYLQDMEDGGMVELPESYLIRLKPHDQIRVVVNSKNPELATQFNSSTSYNSLSGGATAGTPSEGNLQILTIDAEGFVTLPIVGKIQCQGLTRQQLESYIEAKIRDEGYIQDPHVSVRFAELMISVMGEVNRPGRYVIPKDQLTLLEALALAGDMTIYGNRSNVAVVRERGGKNIITHIDLRSSEALRSSCYYIEQNDIIIVSPNKYRAATAEINQNRSFWVSLTTTAISVATFLVTLLK